MNKQDKICQNCKNEFTIEPEDFEFYDKIKVPPPTFCPECRMVRRLAWNNTRNFYKRLLENGKFAISIYSEDKPFSVVEDKYWWSDKWDPMEYGQDYDFEKSFFKQFRELMERVPLPHLQRNYSTFVRSEYCNAASYQKDCYMISMADNNENCLYGYTVEKCNDCVDITFINKSELCYEGVNIKSCYNAMFSQDCDGSRNIWFSFDCKNCFDCFGCTGLRNKQYYIFNKQFTKEDYLKKIKEFNLGSFKSLQRMKKKSEETSLMFPYKFIRENKTSNIIGDYIYQSKNIYNSFFVEKSENCKYSQFLRYITNGTTDSYDYSVFGLGADRMYESTWCGIDISNVKFSFWNYGGQDIEYSFGCHSSKNIFGCVGLRHKQFCIFNKQYAEKDFNNLKAKIMNHMDSMPYIDGRGNVYKYGEFFPPEVSPFAYNETMAQDFCSLTKDKIIEGGYKYIDVKKFRGIHAPTITTDKLSDDIKDVKDGILNEIIECDNSTLCRGVGAFKIIPRELEFYRKWNVPLPRLCLDCRHYERIKKLNPLKLWHRKCQCAGIHSDNKVYTNTTNHHHHSSDHCPNEFETTYSPERKEIVYCEDCYLQEVV